MASRFFYGSDSESSSSDEEDVYDHSEKEEEDSEAEDSSEKSSASESEESDDEAAGKGGAANFLRDVSDSEESEDEEKVTIVKSAKDKRLEGLENTIRLIENAEKINDWAVISTGEFALREMRKAADVWESKRGADGILQSSTT